MASERCFNYPSEMHEASLRDASWCWGDASTISQRYFMASGRCFNYLVEM
ncbi:MAG: hypothetical protein QOJ98_3196, partial [Acidobacteriota bacterium]|nr:hypothetical protein [Acidobacteriota bacterium]